MELLERETNLAALRSYADEARSGLGRLVLIAGEAGVGKTTLLEALRSEIVDSAWAWGGCDGLFTPRPLSPLHDLARDLGGEVRAACEAGAERGKLFDAFVAALRAADRLTVVVIEDVHWADEASLDFIRYTSRRLSGAPALLLVTYRDDGADPLLRTALGDLASHRGTRRMALPCLSDQAVRQLADGTAFEQIDLHQLTGGNPYFLSEVLAGDGEHVPPSARDAVLGRASRLSIEARTALDATALVGAQADPTLLQRLPDVTGAGLDACVSAGLLVTRGGALDFRHDIARLAIEMAVPPERSAQLHREIFDELRAMGSSDDAELAYHADLGRDSVSVLNYAPRAARAAAGVASHREAAAHYEAALRHAAGEEPAVRARLYECFADETAFVDRWEESLAAREEALAIWRTLGDDLRAGDALQMMVLPLWRLCRGAECSQAAAGAVALLEPLPPGPELALAWLRLAESKWDEGNPDEALRLVHQARELAESLNAVEVVTRCMLTEGCFLAALERDGLATLREALELGLAHGLDNQVGGLYHTLYEILSGHREVLAAEEIWKAGLPYCEDRNMTTYTECLRGHRTRSLTQQGLLFEATELTNTLLARHLPSPLNRINPLIANGVLLARRGEHDAAATSLDEALALSVGIGEEPRLLRSHTGHAERHWLAGNDDLAATSAAAACTVLAAGDGWTRGEALVWALASELRSTRPSLLPHRMHWSWPVITSQRLSSGTRSARITTRRWPSPSPPSQRMLPRRTLGSPAWMPRPRRPGRVDASINSAARSSLAVLVRRPSCTRPG